MAKISVPVVRGIMDANERFAAENRELFDRAGILAVNIISSPGAGKTTLLERTAESWAHSGRMAVIEGDLQTANDAERVHSKGVRAVQINTDGACHLDGNMVQTALKSLDLDGIELLIIENVGNLVCPAEFNLGEHHRVAVLSVTEGDDKPVKYPLIFQRASVLLLNKIDLLPYVDFDLEAARRFALKVNPDLEILEISCRTGEGVDGWTAWLERAMGQMSRR